MTWNLSGVSPKRDWSSKSVELFRLDRETLNSNERICKDASHRLPPPGPTAPPPRELRKPTDSSKDFSLNGDIYPKRPFAAFGSRLWSNRDIKSRSMLGGGAMILLASLRCRYNNPFGHFKKKRYTYIYIYILFPCVSSTRHGALSSHSKERGRFRLFLRRPRRFAENVVFGNFFTSGREPSAWRYRIYTYIYIYVYIYISIYIYAAFYDRGSKFPVNIFWRTWFLNPKSSECQSCREKMTFSCAWFIYGITLREMQSGFCWSQCSGEVWSSLRSSEEPQNIKGEPLS